MSQVGLFLRRALVGQPIGVTLNQISGRLLKRRKGPSQPGPSEAARPHPFDAQHGTDSGGQISAMKLATGSGADSFNVGFISSQPTVIRGVLKGLPDLETATFIDIGCGKGRPLLVATEFPFRRIVGVEINEGLADIADANARIMAGRFPERTRVEVARGDMRAFVFPSGYLVVYFYNSTFRPLIEMLVRRLEAHVRDEGAKVVLIYYNPAEARIVDASHEFSRVAAFRVDIEDGHIEYAWGQESVVVWQSTGAPMLTSQPRANAKVKRTAGGLGGEVVL